MRKGETMVHIQIDEQLELRSLQPSDAEELFALTDDNRAYLKQWLPWLDFTLEVADSLKFIEQTMKQEELKNGFQTGIFYEGRLVGVIALHGINRANESTSIGYWLAEDAGGKGIMTKATESVVTYIFEELKLNRVEIKAATGNVRSKAIPERLGFVHEGTLRQAEWLYDHYVNHELYAMLREDYEKLKQV